MKLTSMEVDADAIESGEWIGDLPECGDLRLFTKGLGCAAFLRMQQAKLRALPRNVRNAPSGIDPVVIRRVNLECAIETCLSNWSGLQDEAGAEIPYSKEFARKLAENPRARTFHDAVITAAGQVGEQRAEDLDIALGNSAAASSGT